MPERYGEYRQFIRSLNQYRQKLGILEDPDTCVIVIPGTETLAKPIGSFLPIYPEDQTGTEEGKFPKVLFNLKSLAGFEAPSFPSFSVEGRVNIS